MRVTTSPNQRYPEYESLMRNRSPIGRLRHTVLAAYRWWHVAYRLLTTSMCVQSGPGLRLVSVAAFCHRVRLAKGLLWRYSALYGIRSRVFSAVWGAVREKNAVRNRVRGRSFTILPAKPTSTAHRETSRLLRRTLIAICRTRPKNRPIRLVVRFSTLCLRCRGRSEISDQRPDVGRFLEPQNQIYTPLYLIGA